GLVRQERVRGGPAHGPLGGWARAPRVAVRGEEDNRERREMPRRFWVSAALALPTVLVAMSDLLPGAPLQKVLSPRALVFLQLALASPAVLWAGRPLFERGWASIVNRHLNMFTLIALGIGVAYLFSVVAALAPGILPDAFRAHGGAPPVYFEAAAVITALVLLGQVMELRARSRTSSAIKALLGLAPKQARRLRDGGVEEDVP